MNEDQDAKIRDLQLQLGAVMSRSGLTPQEAVACAAEFLTIIVMSALRSERAAHEMLNSCTENSHLYINENWPEFEKMKEEEIALNQGHKNQGSTNAQNRDRRS